MAKNNKPVKKISYGSVNASIFVNVDKESGNSWFSVNIQKFYNEGTKKKPEWAYTSSFNVVDMMDLQLIQYEVTKWMREHKASEVEEDEE